MVKKKSSQEKHERRNVKCPFCKNLIRTREKYICQCPVGEGCGKKIEIKENEIKI